MAYVGHDFGAMYGTLAAAVDPRVTHFVFMAGTASFSDWFLYGPKLEERARDRFVADSWRRSIRCAGCRSSKARS